MVNNLSSFDKTNEIETKHNNTLNSPVDNIISQVGYKVNDLLNMEESLSKDIENLTELSLVLLESTPIKSLRISSIEKMLEIMSWWYKVNSFIEWFKKWIFKNLDSEDLDSRKSIFIILKIIIQKNDDFVKSLFSQEELKNRLNSQDTIVLVSTLQLLELISEIDLEFVKKFEKELMTLRIELLKDLNTKKYEKIDDKVIKVLNFKKRKSISNLLNNLSKIIKNIKNS